MMVDTVRDKWPDPLVQIRKAVEGRHGVRMTTGSIAADGVGVRGSIEIVAPAQELTGCLEDVESALREWGMNLASGSFQLMQDGWNMQISFERRME